MFPLSTLIIISHALVTLARTTPGSPQSPWLDQTPISKTAEAEKVPGANNVTFCPNDNDPLFQTEFLEMAPIPIETDRIFFIYLHGSMPFDAASPSALSKATFRLNITIHWDAGSTHDAFFEFPLATSTGDWFDPRAHLTIHNDTHITEFLTPGDNDIMIDNWFPSYFFDSGWYVLHAEGVLEDGRRLFCMQVEQHLTGCDDRCW